MYYFDNKSIDEIATTVVRQKQTAHNLLERVSQLEAMIRSLSRGVSSRFAKTTTGLTYSTYPTSGSQFVIEFLDRGFSMGVNTAAATTDTEWNGRLEVARTLDGSFIEQGTIVEAIQIPDNQRPGGHWWILPATGYIGKPATAIADGAAGTMNLYKVTGRSSPAEASLGATVQAYNKTGGALTTSELYAIMRAQNCELPVVVPLQAGSGGGGGGNSTIVLVRANNVKAPGASVSCDLMQFSGGSWSDSGTDVTVYDVGNNVCLLDEEYAWAQDMAGDGSRYEFVGQYGLVRRAVMDADVDVHSSGNATILAQSSVCVMTTSNLTVSVCNGQGSGSLGATRKLFNGDYLTIRYQNNLWNVVAPERIPLVGKPTTNLQDGSSGTFNLWTFSSGTWAAKSPTETVTAYNETGLTFSTTSLYRIDYFEYGSHPLATPIQYGLCT